MPAEFSGELSGKISGQSRRKAGATIAGSARALIDVIAMQRD